MIDNVLDKIFKKLDKTTIDKIGTFLFYLLIFLKYYLCTGIALLIFMVGFVVGLVIGINQPQLFIETQFDSTIEYFRLFFFNLTIITSLIIGLFACLISFIDDAFRNRDLDK